MLLLPHVNGYEIMKKKTLLSWSSGKDSAWALHALRHDPHINILGLFSVVNQKYGRVSMHSTRLQLLQRQAEAAGLPLHIINIPDQCTVECCDTIMSDFVQESLLRGIESMAFGDLFLQEVRTYRENQLRGSGIIPIFPLWGTPTAALADQMLTAGVEAYISCVDPKKVPASLAGRQWSRDLLRELPKDVDPCGENGEFHTVVVGGPMLRKSIPVHIG